MKQATPVSGFVKVLSVEKLPNGLSCLMVPCADYAELRTLPTMLDYQGARYGRTGWNSDRHLAYYKTGQTNYARIA